MPQTDIQKRLFALQDKAYGAFSAKLIPHKDPACVIGVRLPELRKLAKELGGAIWRKTTCILS